MGALLALLALLRPAALAAAAPPCFQAAAWPQADRLFRGDPHWVGSDGAFSVDLGDGRTLWLFGDTWIDPSGRHARVGARMVRNTVAIQTGSDPSRASITFYWRSAADGEPDAFFGSPGKQWYWPGHGLRLRGELVLFLTRIRAASTGLGFESAGWTAVTVSNPDDDPLRWRVVPLGTPSNPLGVVVGFAGVLRWDDDLYAFGAQEPVKSHPVFAVRWPLESVRRGNLRAPRWWAGADMGWVRDGTSIPRWPLFENGQSELTVHWDGAIRQFLAVQTVGFGAAEVALRWAPELTGPWSPPQVVYRPPESDLPGGMVYSAKAHPQLTGADLVLTYATNTFRFENQLSDSLIYYPRFVRLTRCR